MALHKYYFRLDCAYQGTLFYGYAIQPGNLRTVQGELQKLLTAIFRQPVKLVASGRTDRGVHAYHQVCSFQVELNWTPNLLQIKNFLNHKTPNDLVILDLQFVTCHFHARYSAKNKTYHYLISQKLDVMRGHLIHFVPSGINYPKLVEALKLFVGTHDFLSFSQTTKTNSVRTIYWIKFDHRNDLITIKINANGFLHSMVRMLVGAGLAYARNKISWHQLNYALTHPQKGGLGMKAPAAGLYLATVKY